MLKSKAAKNPWTSNPFIIDEAKSTSKAFITNVNSPKVKIFIGNVSKIIIGFKTTLIIAKKAASQMAVHKFSTATSGIK